MISTKKAGRAMVMAAVALLFVASGALAQQKEDFTPERFAALQQQNALILLDVFADWCPTCAQQQRVLAEYREKHGDVPLHILTIDFDSQKEYVRQFRAPRQSTFILYRGEERLWFSVAETSADVIFAALNEGAAASR
jgi:thioredoxin 1